MLNMEKYKVAIVVKHTFPRMDEVWKFESLLKQIDQSKFDINVYMSYYFNTALRITLTTEYYKNIRLYLFTHISYERRKHFDIIVNYNELMNENYKL